MWIILYSISMCVRKIIIHKIGNCVIELVQIPPVKSSSFLKLETGQKSLSETILDIPIVKILDSYRHLNVTECSSHVIFYWRRITTVLISWTSVWHDYIYNLILEVMYSNFFITFWNIVYVYEANWMKCVNIEQVSTWIFNNSKWICGHVLFKCISS